MPLNILNNNKYISYLKTKIRLLLYTLAIWFIFVIFAILNGLFRTFFLEHIGYGGHLISTIVLVCFILVVVSIFINRIKIDYTKTDLLLIGAIWLILSILFEFVFGHYVLGISWDILFADYNILKGRMWSFVLLTEFIAPLLFGLKSQLKYRLNIYTQKLLRSKLESKILLGSGMLIVIFLIIDYLSPELFLNDLENPSDTLTTNANILATIFAITISLTLLGLQYLSESLTPRIVLSFIKSKFITGLLLSYIFSILINIFVISFPKMIEARNFVYYSYLLLIWCVLYLTSYLFYMIRKIQPTSALYEIDKQIPFGYDKIIIHKLNQGLINLPDEQDKFIDLEQIVIKTIRNNDFFSFRACLDLLFKKQINFLNNLLKIEPDNERGYNQIQEDAESISLYFLRIQKQIYFEILREENERFLLHYAKEIVEIIKLLLKLKAIRPLRELNDHFNDIGLQIIDKKFHSTFQFYCRLLDDVAKNEFLNIPSGNQLSQFQDTIMPYNTLTKKERDECILGEIISDFFSLDRLKFFEDFSAKASDKGYEDIIVSVKHSLTELLDLAIKKDDNKKMQNWLIGCILNSLDKIHNYSLKNKIDTKFFGLLGFHHVIESLKDEQINSIGIPVTKYYCNASINSLKNDYYFGIWELGVEGKVLITKYPQLTEIVVDCLIECLKIVSEDNKLKNINKETVVNLLDSIYLWNEHKHKNIEDKIDKTFVKYKFKIKTKKGTGA